MDGVSDGCTPRARLMVNNALDWPEARYLQHITDRMMILMVRRGERGREAGRQWQRADVSLEVPVPIAFSETRRGCYCPFPFRAPPSLFPSPSPQLSPPD